MCRKIEYVDSLVNGQLIAFKIGSGDKEKVISGMVKEVNNSYVITETKNGVKFNVKKKNIIWVKTGERWPKGVYLALKGKAGADEFKRR